LHGPLLEQSALMKIMLQLTAFLPAFLADDPLGLFLLIAFASTALALLILLLASLVLP
jgi:hypothetical protein